MLGTTTSALPGASCAPSTFARSTGLEVLALGYWQLVSGPEG